jgi:hypothetical protein
MTGFIRNQENNKTFPLPPAICQHAKAKRKGIIRKLLLLTITEIGQQEQFQNILVSMW